MQLSNGEVPVVLCNNSSATCFVTRSHVSQLINGGPCRSQSLAHASFPSPGKVSSYNIANSVSQKVQACWLCCIRDWNVYLFLQATTFLRPWFTTRTNIPNTGTEPNQLKEIEDSKQTRHYILSVITPFSTELLTESQRNQSQPQVATIQESTSTYQLHDATLSHRENLSSHLLWNVMKSRVRSIDILCAVSTPQREMSLRTPNLAA